MRTFAWMVLLALFLGIACSNDPVADRELPRAMHRPDVMLLDREADDAALWLSGELSSPFELYETILDDLSAIRAEYSANIPVLDELEFLPWWTTSRIGVHVTTEVRNKVLAHEPNPLDSLNTAYRAASMGSFQSAGANRWRNIVLFTGRQHPERLSEIYRVANGIPLAFPDSWIGDFSNVYPWHIDGGMSYLFRLGLGDCLAGCESSDFYYFRRVGGVTEYVGSFRLYVDPYPAWWSEASAAFCEFMMQQWGFPTCPWSVSEPAQSQTKASVTQSSF